MLDEVSRDITTFSDGVSLYRFKRLPFGLNCSPAIFSRQIAIILSLIIKQGWVRNYLDDVTLWAPDFDTLGKRLDTLFQSFTQSGVKLNLSKCAFGQSQVKFLGHIVSAEGCKEAIRDMKAPTR